VLPLAALGGILVADFVSALVGIPATALASAAEADKLGFTTGGMNARYFYKVKTGVDGKSIELVAPLCYVVAYAKPVDREVSWCDNSAFKTGAPDSCKNGKALLDNLRAQEVLPVAGARKAIHVDVPDFYAEIAFDASGYPPVVKPRLASFYYPASLLWPASKEPRTIALSLTQSLAGADPSKGASVAMTITAVRPAPHHDPDSLINVEAAWTILPQAPVKPDDPKPVPGVPYFPVNVLTNFHEVGEPSIFLATFASAFKASAADISKTITNAILPSAQAAAEQQTESNQAAFESKLSAALKSYGEYLAACAKPPATNAEKATAENLYFAVVANRRSANLAAVTANQKRPYDPPESGLVKCF